MINNPAILHLTAACGAAVNWEPRYAGQGSWTVVRRLSRALIARVDSFDR